MIRLATMRDASLADAFHRALDPIEARRLVLDYMTRSSEGIEAVTPYFARAKGETGGLVGYRVGVEGGGIEHVSVRVASAGRLRAAFERLRSKKDSHATILSPVVFVPDRSALLTTLPLDRGIPGLGNWTDIRRVRRHVAAAGVHGRELRVSKSRSTWKVVSFRPERRAVLRWRFELRTDSDDLARPEQAYVRVQSKPIRAHCAWWAINSLAEVGFPAPLPISRPESHVMIEGAVPGRSPEGHALPLEELGALVARLHRTPFPAALPRIRPSSRIAAAARAVDGLRPVDACLYGRARRAWVRHDVRTPGPDDAPVFLHGDLHTEQVVLSDRLSLVDFDRACVGSPAADVAQFAAHLTLAAPGAEDSVRFAMDRFRAGYETLRRWPDLEIVRWHFGVALLALADAPFRRIDPSWRATTRQLLDRIEEVT